MLLSLVKLREFIMPIDGFIIEAENGSFLDSGYDWRKCSHQSETFVHPEEELGSILIHSQNWNVKPANLYPARFDHTAEKLDQVSLLSEKALRIVFP